MLPRSEAVALVLAISAALFVCLPGSHRGYGLCRYSSLSLLYHYSYTGLHIIPKENQIIQYIGSIQTSLVLDNPTDKRQIPESLGVVHSIADYKFVADRKTLVLNCQLSPMRSRFVKECNNLY